MHRDKIDVSTICRTVSRFRLMLLRPLPYAEAVPNNTPGFRYITDVDFAAALA